MTESYHDDAKASSPSYYAVIPADVRYHPDLPPNAKLLYGEVTALCNKEGFCWATNQYFADLYHVKPNAVKTWLRALETAGFIGVLLDATGSRRRICLAGGGSKKRQGGIKKDTGWYPKRSTPRIKKNTHNITLTTPKKMKRNTVGEADDGTQAVGEKSFSFAGGDQKEEQRRRVYKDGAAKIKAALEAARKGGAK